VLVPLVAQTPGGIAAVLSDEEGEALDYVHDPRVITAIDVQLLAAQVGQTIRRLHRDALRHRMIHPCVLLETPTHKLMSASLGQAFTLAFLLQSRANLAKAFSQFEASRHHIERLLE